MLKRTVIASRCTKHRWSLQQIRAINTQPLVIPDYVETWNPATHKRRIPRAIRPLARNRAAPPARGLNQDERAKMQRKELAETQNPIVTLDEETITDHGLNPKRRESLKFAIQRLNKGLVLAGRLPSKPEVRAFLWRAYKKAKLADPNIISIIPNRAWDVIWASRMDGPRITPPSTIRWSPRRARINKHAEYYMWRERLCELYRDMDAVGKAMTVQQRVRWIESLFFNKQEYCALREWEDDRLESDPSKRHDYKPEHLQSGARMYAYADNVRRSRQLLDELYELHPSWEPSIILPVFRAHARSKSRDHRSMAWGLYEKRLNFPIKLSRKELDGYFIGFIEAQDLRHAIIVFNSMLKDGHLTGKLSERMINRVLRKLNLLYRLGTNIESMTSIALSVISNLPRPYHPHLFGDWLKAAVRARAPEAAAQILEIMFQRGTTPRTIHFNLFLRTLLRSEKRQHDLKAENIGWEMVDQCDKTSPPEAPHINTADAIVAYGKADQEGRNNKTLERITPRANVVTFGLLMLRHSNLSQWEHVEYLSRRLRELGIPPNVDVLNSMIRYYSARGNYNKVWETYKTMTHVPNNVNRGVFPNGMTFRLLWRTLRIALGDKNRKENIELPSPRYLLAETIRWTDMVRSRWDAQRFREGLAAENLEAISTLVMHCFSYTDDLAGSIVALYALRRRFDVMPTKELATVLQTHAAWTDLHLETKSVRTQFSLSKTFPNKMQQLGRIFAILKDARSKRLNITDDVAVTLSKDEQAELNLNLLSEFVRVISKRQHSPETIEAMIDQAKKDVGLPTLKIGDMDAFEVL